MCYLTNASFIVHARIERVKIMEIDVKYKLGSILIDLYNQWYNVYF